MNEADQLINYSFYFASRIEIEKNAMRFVKAREDEKRVDLMAKSHKRPTFIDKAKSYFQAVV